MANRSKEKGSRAERDIVNKHKEIGIFAERVPLSGAAGGSFEGDLLIGEFRAEVKCRANGTGFKVIESWIRELDILFLKRDRQEPLVAMPWRVYEKLISDGVKNKLAEWQNLCEGPSFLSSIEDVKKVK